MPHLDYTQRARRFVTRYPVWNGVLTQIGFWVLANVVLAVLLHFMYASVNENVALPLPPRLWPGMVVGIIIGILYGAVPGITEYFLETLIACRRVGHKYSFALLFKAAM